MANRNNRQPMGNRRDFGRLDRSNGLPRQPQPPVSPWQQGPGAPMGILTQNQTTLDLANNLITHLLSRQNTVPSLLDMPIRRDFAPDRAFDRGFNRINQPNFRQGPANFNRPNDRPVFRKNFQPHAGARKPGFQRKDDNRPKQTKESKPATVTKKVEDQKDEVKKEKSEDASEPMEQDAAPAEEKPEIKEEKGKSPYDAVNSALLVCHICNKTMWDGRSFENHLNGRAHAIMMQKTAESYALSADTMRQEIKIREIKHYRKLGKPMPSNFFCQMCDMYAQSSAAHRTTVGHRRLKKFLHPACAVCQLEMPTRIELDEHRLSAEHLLKTNKKQENKIKPEWMTIATQEQEELFIRHDRAGRPGGAGEERDYEEAADVVLDGSEGEHVGQLRPEQIPKYLPERGVGQGFLTPVTVFRCSLCRKLLDSRETADTHVRTWRHHALFVKHLRRGEVARKRAATADQDTDDAKRMKTEEDGDVSEQRGTEEEDEATPEGEEGGEGPEGDDAERWEQDIESIINDISDDIDQVTGHLEEKRDTKEDDTKEEDTVEDDNKADAQEEKEPEEVKEEIKEDKTPRTPGRARGRGRGRAARGRKL